MNNKNRKCLCRSMRQTKIFNALIFVIFNFSFNEARKSPSVPISNSFAKTQKLKISYKNPKGLQESHQFPVWPVRH